MVGSASPMSLTVRGRSNRRVAPASGAAEEEAQKRAEEAAADGSPPASTSAPTPTQETSGGAQYGSERSDALVAVIGKPDYIFLTSRFSGPWTDALTDEEARAEARWHRLEEAGFPDGIPTEESFREHYAQHHPGSPVPTWPGSTSGARSGRLPRAVIDRLGLAPLGTEAKPGEEVFYEPAIVTAGALITARDGTRWRVIDRGGQFDVELLPASEQPSQGSAAGHGEEAVQGTTPDRRVLSAVLGGLAGAVVGVIVVAISVSASRGSTSR